MSLERTKILLDIKYQLTYVNTPYPHPTHRPKPVLCPVSPDPFRHVYLAAQSKAPKINCPRSAKWYLQINEKEPNN